MLIDYLAEDKKYRLHLIRKKTQEYLKYIVAVFPEYTDHSIKHPDRAIEILNNWLLDDEQKQKLKNNQWENYFLHAALYLHDIGMIEHPLLSTPPNLQFEQKREFIRKTHHERSYKLIMSLWEELAIEDEFQAEIIANICLGHREIKLDNPKIRKKIPYRQSGRLIDIQFLTACLRLADELDLTFQRTSHNIFGLIQEKSKITEIEWNKHFSIGGVGPHEHYVGTICVWCRCRNAELHRALKKHEAKVQLLLNEINRLVYPRFKYSQIVYEIENIEYEPIDYKFRIDTLTALEIFMGNPVYSDKGVFIRELVQNSIDACNVRKMIDPNLIPSISVTMGKDFDDVTVKDNGIGMDREWIEKYFLPVGLSFYRSEGFEDLKSQVDIGFSPISCFGIGILSCFMVADKIIIKTRKPPSPGLEITIADVNSYFDVQENPDLPQGTEVRVVFKDKVPTDCLGYMMRNIKCTKWPIEYVYYDGEKIEIGQEPVSLIEKMKLRHWKYNWKNYIEVDIPFVESEGYLAFEVSGIKSPKRISTRLADSEFTIFQDGIYVGNEPELLPNWAHKGIIGRVNLYGGERLDLSITRISVIKSGSKFQYVKMQVKQGVINLWENLFSTILNNISDKEKIHLMISSIVNGYFNIVLDEDLQELLRKYYCFSVFDPETNNRFGYFSYNELLLLDRKIVIFHSGRKFNLDDIHPRLRASLFVKGRDARILNFVHAGDSVKSNIELAKRSTGDIISSSIY